jgi:FkbM family methyltransferase
MSDFNVDWLKDNINSDATIFYIGAAGLNEVLEFRKKFPKANIHAFECSKYWINRYSIFEKSKQNNIEYHQLAVSDVDGKVLFFQSEKNREENWPQSGSLFKPTKNTKYLTFSSPIEVDSIRLDTFCEKNVLYPTFIHVDAQGAEFAIFSSMGKYKPKIIWTEISEFNMYATGVTYEDFNTLLINLGYKKIIQDKYDELYALKDIIITDYIKKDSLI